MKIFIFFLFLVAVFTVVGLKWRKSQIEATIARRKSIERRKDEEKESMTPVEDKLWPTVGPKEEGEVEEETDYEGPSMATIEWVPPDKMTT